MPRSIKLSLAVILSFCLVFSSTTFVDAHSSIMPVYNNAISASGGFSINSTGTATIKYQYVGLENVTSKAVITSYIEKRFLGIFWTRVDIGVTDNTWTDVITDYIYTGSRSYKLSDSGTYRVTIQYQIYGSGGDVDEITQQYQDSY